MGRHRVHGRALRRLAASLVVVVVCTSSACGLSSSPLEPIAVPSPGVTSAPGDPASASIPTGPTYGPSVPPDPGPNSASSRAAATGSPSVTASPSGAPPVRSPSPSPTVSASRPSAPPATTLPTATASADDAARDSAHLGASDARAAAPGSAKRLAGAPAGSRGVVYLTFDDGPSAYTPQVLRILTRYHSTATFFELGNHVAELPQLSAAVRAQGSVVGNHTYDHPDLTKLRGARSGQNSGVGPRYAVPARRTERRTRPSNARSPSSACGRCSGRWTPWTGAARCRADLPARRGRTDSTAASC